MRKTTKLFLGFTAGLLLLCGCSAAEEKLGYENADVAKEALASASSVRMRCDLDNVDASGNIYADEKAAAYMKNSGLFDQTWTISISGEEWFHMKIVTDEEINKMTKSATTYAFYDPDNNLLGYAQERVTTPDQMPEAFVCNCDLTAGLLMLELEKRGISVPEDVSVVGFDNYLYPGFPELKITSYEINTKAMVKVALEKALK